MEVVVCKTKEEASKLAAAMITEAVKKNPRLVLGLATDSTPVLMYSEMAKAVKAKKVSYKQVKSWNLDEYVGLAGTHDQSYRYFMNENLFKKIDIKLSNTHVLNGLAKDPEKECRAYEAQIKKAGGIDIQVLGIGSDGHIAFNEPGTSSRAARPSSTSPRRRSRTTPGSSSRARRRKCRPAPSRWASGRSARQRRSSSSHSERTSRTPSRAASKAR